MSERTIIVGWPYKNAETWAVGKSAEIGEPVAVSEWDEGRGGDSEPSTADLSDFEASGVVRGASEGKSA